MNIRNITEQIINGKRLTKDDDLSFLLNSGLDELTECADKLRRHFSGSRANLCSIINGRSGRCSEDCKFCAQSSCSSAEIPEYKVRDTDYVVTDAKKRNKTGITHYC